MPSAELGNSNNSNYFRVLASKIYWNIIIKQESYRFGLDKRSE